MGAPSSSFMCNNRKDEKEETNAKMSKVMSCHKLLIVHVLGVLMESVSVINGIEVETCEENEKEVISSNGGIKPRNSKGFHLDP